MDINNITLLASIVSAGTVLWGVEKARPGVFSKEVGEHIGEATAIERELHYAITNLQGTTYADPSSIERMVRFGPEAPVLSEKECRDIYKMANRFYTKYWLSPFTYFIADAQKSELDNALSRVKEGTMTLVELLIQPSYLGTFESTS